MLYGAIKQCLYCITGSWMGLWCNETDWETDMEVNYIDFDINGVEFITQ